MISVAEFVTNSRKRQGLPIRVRDPVAVDRIARLVGVTRESAPVAPGTPSTALATPEATTATKG